MFINSYIVSQPKQTNANIKAYSYMNVHIHKWILKNTHNSPLPVNTSFDVCSKWYLLNEILKNYRHTKQSFELYSKFEKLKKYFFSSKNKEKKGKCVLFTFQEKIFGKQNRGAAFALSG